ncbi:MAG: hypothetical protein AAFY88_12035 [Acidobacteriota bacterium]
MKKLFLLAAVALFVAVVAPAFASNVSPMTAIDELIAAPGLPQLPMLEAIAGSANFSGGTCAKIRPVALHSDCTYSLCESYGCGAPFRFDAVDCACYCGYAF